jgi:hypothetical protein
MILEIERDYKKILSEFESGLTKEEYYRFKEISENELLALLREVMSFQRTLEQILASVGRIVGKTEYSKRLNTIANDFLRRLNATEAFEQVRFSTYQDPAYPSTFAQGVSGVITELKSSSNKLLHGDLEACRRGCYRAYFGLKSLQSGLIEFEEELRLISALTTYPIEKKIKLKERLVLNDFQEVAISLEEAESNVEVEHFKDCVSRCRDAIEIFVASVREKETGEKTEKHFSTDLAKLVNIGVFDESVQRLAQGVYSFTSLKGSHKYEASKVTVYDAENALEHTYSLVEMLVERYLQLRKESQVLRSKNCIM